MVDFGIDDDEVVFSQGDLGFIGAQPSFAVGYVEEFGQSWEWRTPFQSEPKEEEVT